MAHPTAAPGEVGRSAAVVSRRTTFRKGWDVEQKRGPLGNLVLILCVGTAIFLVVILALSIFSMAVPGRL
ncbi:MAG TPA: hypothetical protein VM597_15710 [Gemmataceae bacterium]|nr:hypothetical protein [Gemmataceae bacterium]